MRALFRFQAVRNSRTRALPGDFMRVSKDIERPSRHYGEAAHARQRVSVGHRAGLREHRSFHDRGGLRGRGRHRARRLVGPARRTGRPAPPGRLPRPNGAGARPVRVPRRRRGHLRQAGAPAPACLRRRTRPDPRRGEGPLGRHQAAGEGRARRGAPGGRNAAGGRRTAFFRACPKPCPASPAR